MCVCVLLNGKTGMYERLHWNIMGVVTVHCTCNNSLYCTIPYNSEVNLSANLKITCNFRMYQ